MNKNLGVGTEFTIPRVPGRMNLNTLRYTENFAALLDDPRYFSLDMSGVAAGKDQPPTMPDATGEARDWWSQFLASRDAVDKRARDASAKLVPGQSLNQVQLISSVNQLASGASIRNPGINGLPDETIANSNLAIHSVRVTLNRVLWTNLRDFYLELQKRRPYITIDDMTVSMTDQRMGTHDVVMTLSSIEVKE